MSTVDSAVKVYGGNMSTDPSGKSRNYNTKSRPRGVPLYDKTHETYHPGDCSCNTLYRRLYLFVTMHKTNDKFPCLNLSTGFKLPAILFTTFSSPSLFYKFDLIYRESIVSPRCKRTDDCNHRLIKEIGAYDVHGILM